MTARKAGEGDARREGVERGRGRPRREPPRGLGASGSPGAPEASGSGGADRAREMVMVDPWGALLAGLLEPAEDGEGPTEVSPTPGKGAARKR